MWVRGLKHRQRCKLAAGNKSHPMWVRGLKRKLEQRFYRKEDVAPYVGAWIETMHLTLILPSAYSRTLCGCIKLSIEDHWGENESLLLSMSKWLGLMQQIFNENNELKDVDLEKLFDCWNS